MNKKQKEALRRLKVLQEEGLMSDVVEQFEKNGQVFFSDFNGFAGVLYYIESAPDKVLNEIERINENDGLVYHVTHEKFEFGECWDLFVITDEDVSNDEYGIGMREDFDEYGLQFAYVVNTDVPEFSEYGSIQVKALGGGVVRIA